MRFFCLNHSTKETLFTLLEKSYFCSSKTVSLQQSDGGNCREKDNSCLQLDSFIRCTGQVFLVQTKKIRNVRKLT